MSEQPGDTLHVDGFTITCRAHGEMIRVTAVRDGEEASIMVGAAADGTAPPREMIEQVAVSAWWAMHNLGRRAAGLPREDPPDDA
jgi:hypothetical protein